jgi:hypothetical protein
MKPKNRSPSNSSNNGKKCPSHDDAAQKRTQQPALFFSTPDANLLATPQRGVHPQPFPDAARRTNPRLRTYMLRRRRRKQLMETRSRNLLALALLTAALSGCGPTAPETSVTPKDLPYTTHLVMHNGDARKFRLPGGKVIAVWCERPEFPTAGEQTTASGLKTGWGERPFVRPELLWKSQPDGSQVATGWKSYIAQGSVITSGSTHTSEYILFVDGWQFSIIEDLASTPTLSVTIKIIPKPSP